VQAEGAVFSPPPMAPKGRDLRLIMGQLRRSQYRRHSLLVGQRERIQVNFAPTSAPWITRVGRCFYTIIEREIRRGTNRSVGQLGAATKAPSEVIRSGRLHKPICRIIEVSYRLALSLRGLLPRLQLAPSSAVALDQVAQEERASERFPCPPYHCPRQAYRSLDPGRIYSSPI
jgi:hypothetical protein